jgi:hypothetical protein
VNRHLLDGNHVRVDQATPHTHRLVFPDNTEASKQLDGGFSVGGIFPSVVVEFGVSESYAELKRDAWDWLWGSDDLVKLVILLKLTKPSSRSQDDPPQHTGWSAFLELWERSVPGTSSMDDLISGASTIAFRIRAVSQDLKGIQQRTTVMAFSNLSSNDAVIHRFVCRQVAAVPLRPFKNSFLTSTRMSRERRSRSNGRIL